MAPKASSPSTQLIPRLVFDDLEKGFSNREVVVRVIHFWEARNPKKGSLLMGMELLLIDQKSTVIQAFIAANRISYYERNLKPDVVYKIKNFLVIDNKTKYRVSSHKFLIQFIQQTSFDEVIEAEVEDSIERQKFRIRSFAEFEEAVDMNYDLFDAIGKMVLISDDNFNNHIPNGKSDNVVNGLIKGKIEVHLQLKDGPVVRVTLWDNVAANFQKKLMKSTVKPVVLLATTLNPRKFKDMFCLSSTSSTRIFFDNDVDPSIEYFTWLGEEGKNSVVLNSFTSEVTKSEPATIDELYEFLKTDTPQNATFSCISSVVEILPNSDWHYIACTKCACKLKEEDTTLVCNTCNNKNAVGEIRYRVELSVYDKKNVTTFVLFDRDVTKLTGVRAVDILETVQTNEFGAVNKHSSTPQCLLDLAGRTYKFQIKIKPYNFTATRQTFTVTRILEEITGGDKSPKEETVGHYPPDGPYPPDKKEAKTSVVAHSDAATTDDDTDSNNHKEKRCRHK